MSEWHITPDYIVNNWTDELFSLMSEKLVNRKKREFDASRGRRTVSIDELAMTSGGAIRIEKKDGD